MIRPAKPSILKRIKLPPMLALSRRPVLLAALCYAVGIVVGMRIAYALWLWAVVLGLATLAVVLRRARVAAPALALAALMALGVTMCAVRASPVRLPETGYWTVEGVIDGAVDPSASGGVRFDLRDVTVVTEDGERVPIATQVYCVCTRPGGKALEHGQRVAVTGRSYLPERARNPGEFDSRLWLLSRDAQARLYSSRNVAVLERAGFSLRGLSLRLNAALCERIDALFGEGAGIVRAMLVGNRDEIEDEWQAWMERSGVIHLLSVSGLHVGIWYALLSFLLTPIPVSPRVRWGIMAALLFGYAMLTGLPASVLRASVMLLFVAGGRVAKRQVDSLTSLSGAALLILLFRPLDLFMPGFQLSFCAVLGIVLLRPAILRLFKNEPPKAADLFITTISAQVGILAPASVLYGQTSLIGLVANLIAVPLAGVLVPASAAALVLDMLWHPLGMIASYLGRGLVSALLWIAKLSAAVPIAVLRFPPFAWWTSLAALCCLLLCSTLIGWRWRTRLAAMAMALSMALGMGVIMGSFQTRYVQLDVGQGLSGVLHLRGGETIVYDCGNVNGPLAEYLLYRGEDVDALFVSHPHTDHYGGLSELISRKITIHQIYVPVEAEMFSEENDYAEVLAATGAPVTELSAGDALSFRGAEIAVLAPEADSARGFGTNGRSLVLQVEIGNRTLLLTGDADGTAEVNVECDVLQVPHHGSAVAAQDAFLRVASPQIALVSSGVDNAYGHPHPMTVYRLEQDGARVYNTAETGALTISFGNRIRVEAFLR